MNPVEELEYITLLYRVQEHVDQDLAPRRVDLVRLLQLSMAMVRETIANRQRAQDAQHQLRLLEQGQALLFLFPEPSPSAGVCTAVA